MHSETSIVLSETANSNPTDRSRNGGGDRSALPVLLGGNVRHAPALPVPPVEALELEEPEPAGVIGHRNEAVGVADVDVCGAVQHAGPGIRDRTGPAGL